MLLLLAQGQLRRIHPRLPPGMLRTRARHAACTCSRLSTPAPRLARRTLSSTSTSSPQPRSSPAALLLRDLRQLLGRYPLLDEAWNSRLERAVADLERARKARIAGAFVRLEPSARGSLLACADSVLLANAQSSATSRAARRNSSRLSSTTRSRAMRMSRLH